MWWFPVMLENDKILKLFIEISLYSPIWIVSNPLAEKLLLKIHISNKNLLNWNHNSSLRGHNTYKIYFSKMDIHIHTLYKNSSSFSVGSLDESYLIKSYKSVFISYKYTTPFRYRVLIEKKAWCYIKIRVIKIYINVYPTALQSCIFKEKASNKYDII